MNSSYKDHHWCALSVRMSEAHEPGVLLEISRGKGIIERSVRHLHLSVAAYM